MSAADRQAWATPTDLNGLGEVCARWLTRDGNADGGWWSMKVHPTRDCPIVSGAK